MNRVLFVSRNFPPLLGGMERLAFEAAKGLAQQASVTLVGPQGSEAYAPGQVLVVPHQSAARFLPASWWAANKLAKQVSLQVVVGGSGLAAPAVLRAARRSGAQSWCFVHGLDLVVRSRLYRASCLPALRRIDSILANSHNTARLAVEAGIASERIKVLHPGVAIGQLHSPQAFLTAYPQTRGRPLLISVGRLLARKGVVEFIRRALPAVVARHPNVLLVVAGSEPRDALLRKRDEQSILQSAITDSGMQSHVLLTGELSEERLLSLYAAARLMVFPVRDLPGDVEGFGMVALEAAANGVPTVAFAAGGVADAVGEGVSGTLIGAGDYPAMADKISACLSGDSEGISDESCRAFAAGFAWPQFSARLRRLVFNA